ncbi:unnamed protein product [Heligmosomoides polygyrus]|uniref:Endo/exonuclease/phosphatase domain-containing protein n=1 Tax=Heligmosomoides polygyrus TaxID=6339 RepID=A0A183FX47_HELPZ|nr:unnamed protein product [Heligmosomoides polygyrus]
MFHSFRNSATASAGADAHPQSPASVESSEDPWCEDGNGATELVRKSRNVSRTQVATLNAGTLTGRSCELVEALERRRVDFCAVQETRWSCRKSRDIGRGFKELISAILCESTKTTSGVEIIVSERFRDSIVRVGVKRFGDRLMKIVVAANVRLYHFFSAYAPQTSCSDRGKDEFWSLPDEKTAEMPSKNAIVVAGDVNGHVGATKYVVVTVSYGTTFADAKVTPYDTVAHSIDRTADVHFEITPPRLNYRQSRLPTKTWKKTTDAIRQTAQSELGITKPGRRKVDKQAWL